MLAQLNFNQLIKLPTRITENTQTLIDLIVTNKLILNRHSGVLPDVISDHEVIYTIRKKGRTMRCPTKYVLIRSFKKAQPEAISNMIKTAPWWILDYCTTGLQKYDMFYKILTFILDTHAPLTKMRVKANRPFWMTKEYSDLNIQLTKSRKSALQSKNSNEYAQFKQLRNKVSHLKTRLKAAQIRKKVGESNCDSKTCWKIFNNEIGKLKKDERIPDLKLDGRTVTDAKSKLNIMCQSFLKNSQPTIINIQNHQFHSKPCDEEQTIDQITLSINEVTQVIKELETSKPMGYDNIPAEIIKSNHEILVPILTDIFNKLLEEGQMPTILKKTLIVPLYKGKGSKSSIDSYRPISILSTIAKILEKAIYNQLVLFLDNHGKMNDQQHGYRRCRSTTSATLLLTESIRHAADNKQFSIVTYVDFKAAFDFISHEIMIKKLEEIGITGQLLQFFKSYFVERYIIAKKDVISSDSFLLTSGTAQGSSLSGLFFSLYLDDLPEKLPNSQSILFCDDQSMRTSHKNLKEAQPTRDPHKSGHNTTPAK
ncbi:RNA-directed DNA polymerase from mobile element jockey [Folsomia candida]|uniref:RNA-directed DNA polymerase from mobile element jockey n=1 Tax=Folsomia candida TaxID=158441 RepID=A0A226E7Z7_FOLCA|nr:RNA-directed DNA polymerase from mobile element jockey [Folsomia candida]